MYVEKPCCHNVREGQLLLEAAQKERQGRGARHAVTLEPGDPTSRSNASRRHHRRCVACSLLELAGAQEHRPPEAERTAQQRGLRHLGRSGRNGCPSRPIDFTTIGTGGTTSAAAIWATTESTNSTTRCGDWASTTHPSIISGAGGKYFFDDDQQFPDTQQITFEYPGDDKVGDRKMLIYEMRLWSTTYPFNVDSGAEFFGTKGKMFISKRGKFEVRGPRNVVARREARRRAESEVPQNQQNWLDCIKSGKQPNANMEVAVRTATAVHLGNIATRLQRTVHFDPDSQKIVGDDEASALMTRKYREGGYWGIPKGV